MTSLGLSKIPASTYRLQLTEDFNLKKAIAILPYLKELGIDSVYCSPLYDSYSGHGYDVSNPNRLNPKLGTEEDFEAFCAKLKKLELGLILDVVPNHMGIRGGRNVWWQEVLENGPYSEYGSFFDINWSPEKRELQNKVLLPILGNPYGIALENQEIVLNYTDGEFTLHYADFPLPLAPHSYALLFEDAEKNLKDDPYYESFNELITFYHQFPVTLAERQLKKDEGKQRLLELCSQSANIKEFVESRPRIFNGKKKEPKSFDALHRLLEAQFYRLTFWRVASHEINYRRFFNVNELAALCIEKEVVLNAHHRWIFELIEQGKVQGLRIDHPDGLYDPVTYFERLRQRFSVYTIVEKILDHKEHLPENWQIEGTVGYEFINVLSGLFINQEKEAQLTKLYEDFIRKKIDFEETVYQSKKLFAIYNMVSEVEALGFRLDRLSEQNRHYRDFTRPALTKALQEFIACFPVYRTYIGPDGKVSSRDSRYILKATEKAILKAPQVDASIFKFLEKFLLFKLKIKKDELGAYIEFILRLQQVTAPIMAKGYEDTSFYIYNRFISLNEVGGNPIHFGYSISDFHHFNVEKQKKWPYGFVASSTHDTKRNEDVRMRLNVISEIPQEWEDRVMAWSQWNNSAKKDQVPSRNTEYMIYQLLIGVWPKHAPKEDELNTFLERFWEIVLKSIREASQETSWITPNNFYEERLKSFIYTILTPSKTNLFLKDFLSFHKKIDRLGSWNSLSMSVIKMGSCGVVDIYQGNELWNYKLVDPDNRTPIDFDLRKRLLSRVKNKDPIHLFSSHDSGNIKLYLHWKALNLRRKHKDLFLDGEYIPLKVHGEKNNHVVAFMRKYENKFLIVCAARFFTSLVRNDWEEPVGHSLWAKTEIVLPDELDIERWEDLFTGTEVQMITHGKHKVLVVGDIFWHLPVAYLCSDL